MSLVGMLEVAGEQELSDYPCGSKGTDRVTIPHSGLIRACFTTAVAPKNPIRPNSRDEGESEHHPTRCLPSSVCSERPSPTFSSRGAGLKSRTCFFGISSMLS
jgi:hypothetical protein